MGGNRAMNKGCGMGALLLAAFLGAGLFGADYTMPGGGASASQPNTWTNPQTYSVPMVWQHSATPSNPSAGYVKVYAKTDNALYVLNSAGVESAASTPAGAAGGSLTGTYPNPTLNTTQNISKLSNLTTNGYVRTSAGDGTLNVDTVAQTTAALDAMVGDSGAGGTKGLVPAPAAGDAAASKFLKADGTWAATAGGGTEHVKEPVYAATTAAGTLATDYENGDSIDGVSLSTGNRILIKNQSSATENGIYTVNASGAPTRATDLDASGEAPLGFEVSVQNGSTNVSRKYILCESSTTGTIIPGTHSLIFFSSGVGTTNESLTIGINTGNGTTGSGNVTIGHGMIGPTTGTGNIVIGNGNFTGPSTTSNNFVAANSSGISNVYFGRGITNSTALAYTINGVGGTGSNNAGAAINIAGGIGTGTSKGGNVLIRTSPSIGTGSTAQTLYDRYIVVAQGRTLTDATATTVATWTLSSGSTGGGRICATIRVTDGTDFQSMTQYVEVALVNKAGTYTTNITATAGAKAVSAGTLTTTWTMTSTGALQLSADTSLTPSGTNAFVVYYTIENNSQSNVTLP